MIYYPVNEMFATFQGEGVHMGRAAFFVRLHGCPVHCPWCDSAGTWHKDYVPPGIDSLTAMEIRDAVRAEEMDVCVITGGEPAVYNLQDLVSALRHVNIKVHLETSGAFPLRGVVMDWVTLSPKKWKHPIYETVIQADEFKIIVEEPDDIHFYHGLLLEKGMLPKKPIWLHPEWSHREDPKVLKAIAHAVKAGGPTFRAGWQLHKLYRVDAIDKRSREPVPLGGNPANGL